MNYYNGHGQPVTSPIYFESQMVVQQPNQHSYVVYKELPKVAVFNFRPTPHFGFWITKDAESNIDITLRINPKIAISTVGELVTAFVGAKKALSTIM